MHADAWKLLPRKDRARWLKDVEKYPCGECDHFPRRLNPSVCSLGFDLDGEHPGCIVRKKWWKPREAPR